MVLLNFFVLYCEKNVFILFLKVNEEWLKFSNSNVKIWIFIISVFVFRGMYKVLFFWLGLVFVLVGNIVIYLVGNVFVKIICMVCGKNGEWNDCLNDIEFYRVIESLVF